MYNIKGEVMKKYILAILALAFTSLAQAEGNYGGVQFQLRNGLEGYQDAHVYQVTLGQHINKYLSAEINTRLKTSDNDANNTRLEGALIGRLPVGGGFTVYNRAAYGTKMNGTDNFQYWSTEPGLQYAITEDWSIRGGLRFRNAFNKDDNDSTRTWRAATEYSVTKNSSLVAGVDRATGDDDFWSYNFGYNVRF